MGYDREVYEAVKLKLEEYQLEDKAKLEKNKRLFYEKYPRAKDIEYELSRTGILAAKAVLSGANTKEQLMKLKEKSLKLQNELNQILSNAGFPLDYLNERYHCDKCKDKGYIDGKMCSCMRQMLKKEAYDRLNKLSPLELSSFDTFNLDYYSSSPIKESRVSARKRMNDIFNFCKEYSLNFSLKSESLLMQGNTGLGKTHLSLAIANVVINKGFGVIYGSAPQLISKLEREHFNYNKNKDDLENENHLINCDLLILDDLGTEFSTNFSNSCIYNIINSRIIVNKPTIISTNLTTHELEMLYSQRLVSRIMGSHIRLEFLGTDVRQKILDERLDKYYK